MGERETATGCLPHMQSRYLPRPGFEPGNFQSISRLTLCPPSQIAWGSALLLVQPRRLPAPLSPTALTSPAVSGSPHPSAPVNLTYKTRAERMPFPGTCSQSMETLLSSNCHQFGSNKLENSYRFGRFLRWQPQPLWVRQGVQNQWFSWAPGRPLSPNLSVGAHCPRPPSSSAAGQLPSWGHRAPGLPPPPRAPAPASLHPWRSPDTQAHPLLWASSVCWAEGGPRVPVSPPGGRGGPRGGLRGAQRELVGGGGLCATREKAVSL